MADTSLRARLRTYNRATLGFVSIAVVAVLIGAATGMRPGEWRGLTADRVDLAARSILVDRQIGATTATWAPLKTAASRRTIRVGAETAGWPEPAALS
mgnify:CR=1 FL=1